MVQSFEEDLLQAVKKDDIKAFHAFMEKARCGSYRLGRFPMLSLLYLYRSRRILSAYEEAFLKITSFQVLREPVEVSKKFSAKAGKCLRLYLSEVVTPSEMLLILDQTKRLKRVFPFMKPSAAVRERLQAIYSIKYSLGVKFEGDDIILDKRPLNYREKKKIATVCMCSVLAVTVAVGGTVTAIALAPAEGEVTKLSQIDFHSTKEYTLKRDLVLPENYSVERVNCQIIGEGHKLTFEKGATLGALNGKMSDLEIESSGDTIFTSVSENAAIENVTVTVGATITATEGAALVAAVNYGTIKGVTVNVSGGINALAGESDGTNELTFGGIVLNNAYQSKQVYGIIQNCTVNYAQFQLVGEASANAVFGGVAGENNGYLQDCTVKGEIVADTFDLAGVCVVNNGLLSGNINEADLSQSSADTGWNPIAAGIVLRNYYVVQNCENKGDISAVSDCGQLAEEKGRELTVTVGGIAYLNGIESIIERCKNSGAMTATGGGKANVGGISALSYARISNCLSSGNITVTAKNVTAGGIFAMGEGVLYGGYVYFGTVDSCIGENRITVTVTDGTPAYVGGIAGYVGEAGINQGNSVVYVGGGVTDSYFTGECVAEVSRFGNIVGVCGANIYASNSYTGGNIVYHNFSGNYYLQNSFSAFGAALSGDTFEAAADKGATAAIVEEMQNSEGYKSILNALGFVD